MNIYYVTVYDSDPNVSGPSEWPSFTQRLYRARSRDNAVDRAIKDARREARACGQYERGDPLWIMIHDEDGDSGRFFTRV